MVHFNSTPPSGETPRMKAVDNMVVRSGIVETPDLINSSLRPLIDTNAKRNITFLTSVKTYEEGSAERVSLRTPGGSKDLLTKTVTKSAMFGETFFNSRATKLNPQNSVRLSGKRVVSREPGSGHPPKRPI